MSDTAAEGQRSRPTARVVHLAAETQQPRPAPQATDKSARKQPEILPVFFLLDEARLLAEEIGRGIEASKLEAEEHWRRAQETAHDLANSVSGHNYVLARTEREAAVKQLDALRRRPVGRLELLWTHYNEKLLAASDKLIQSDAKLAQIREQLLHSEEYARGYLDHVQPLKDVARQAKARQSTLETAHRTLTEVTRILSDAFGQGVQFIAVMSSRHDGDCLRKLKVLQAAAASAQMQLAQWTEEHAAMSDTLWRGKRIAELSGYSRRHMEQLVTIHRDAERQTRAESSYLWKNFEFAQQTGFFEQANLLGLTAEDTASVRPA